MPGSYDLRAFGFTDGQEGLFYDSALNCLLRGKIVDTLLEATVIHGGSDYDNGRYFSAFSEGYSHFDWDLQHIIWFPENILTWAGFKEWMNMDRVAYPELKAYTKAKRLLTESL